jgi:hypothetical protein
MQRGDRVMVDRPSQGFVMGELGTVRGVEGSDIAVKMDGSSGLTIFRVKDLVRIYE